MPWSLDNPHVDEYEDLIPIPLPHMSWGGRAALIAAVQSVMPTPPTTDLPIALPENPSQADQLTVPTDSIAPLTQREPVLPSSDPVAITPSTLSQRDPDLPAPAPSSSPDPDVTSALADPTPATAPLTQRESLPSPATSGNVLLRNVATRLSSTPITPNDPVPTRQPDHSTDHAPQPSLPSEPSAATPSRNVTPQAKPALSTQHLALSLLPSPFPFPSPLTLTLRHTVSSSPKDGGEVAYTVKQLSELAGISVRTLHYYDEIGLLNPSKVGDNGYRSYDEANLLRLQQILFYREIGMELAQIKTVLADPNFDILTALQSHRRELEQKSQRLQALITTVDNTIIYLSGESNVSKKQLFEAFSDEKQKDYERSARLQYGPTKVNESVKLWNSYSAEKKQQIGDEGNQVYSDLIDALSAGKSPDSPDVQSIVERWHKHIHYFYEPTLEILRNLGVMYNESPDFNATFTRLHPALPEYLQASITEYVDQLETAEITRMLAEDEENRATK